MNDIGLEAKIHPLGSLDPFTANAVNFFLKKMIVPCNRKKKGCIYIIETKNSGTFYDSQI
jgi:hypothetical protein